MLIIRLQRTGKRNQSDFRIVLAEKAAPVSKKITEILGSYNPRKKLFRLSNEERLKYWLSQNVAVSPTVHNLFVSNKVLEGAKVKAFGVPKKSEEVKEAKSAGVQPEAVANDVQVKKTEEKPEGKLAEVKEEPPKQEAV